MHSAAVLLGAACWTAAAVAGAAAPNVPTTLYPTRPIRMVVSQSPGGANDLAIRLISPSLSEHLGQPVVIENRPGAGSLIGTDIVAKSTADGYTLLVTSSSLTIMPGMYRKLPFDPLKDFTAVTSLTSYSFLLAVHSSLPAVSITELIALAKAKPGSLNYASGGTGTPPHMGAELFKSLAGVDIVHVPYKGGGEAIIAVIGGQVQMYVGPFGTVLPYVKSGKLRALGVSSSERSPLLPGVPTVAEAGVVGYQHNVWNGLLAPAHTPPAIIEKLAAAIGAVIKTPLIRERFAADGVEAGGISPRELNTLIRAEIPKWASVIKQAGIKPE